MSYIATFIMASGNELHFNVSEEKKFMLVSYLNNKEKPFVQMLNGTKTCVINISQIERLTFVPAE